MKIDRSLFLILTSALATGACFVEHDHSPPPPAPPPPPPPAQPKLARIILRPEHPAPPRPRPHPFPLPPLHFPGANVTPVAPPAPPIPGPTPGPTPPPAPVVAPDGGAAPAACLDESAAAVPACQLQPLDPSCASNTFPSQRCQTYIADFDPKVAAAAVGCMNKLTGKQLCDSSQAYACGNESLQQACNDPTTAQLCQVAATPCKVGAEDCVVMLSGLNSAGQTAVAQCVAQGCSAGLYSCIEGLNAGASAKH
jgi:hypothetical protein